MTPDVMPTMLARYLAGECTNAEAAAVQRWMAADPEREHLVARLRAAFDAAPPRPERPDVDAMWGRVAATMHSTARQTPGLRRLDTTTPRWPTVSTTPRWPIVGTTPRWPIVGAVVAAAACIVAVVSADRLLSRGPATHTSVREVATATGQRATLVLADGSRVILGVRSHLRMPERFGDGPREVTLDGEAYFEVRHDAAHPFRVHTANGIAEDLGTRFIVRAYAGDSTVRVVVADGRVSLAPAVPRTNAAPLAITAGQLASLGLDGPASVRRVDTTAYLAWTEGRLVFDGAPIGEVLTELGRWYDLDIHLAAPALAGRHISASFTGEAESVVLGAVAAAAGLRYTRHGRSVTFSRAGGLQ